MSEETCISEKRPTKETYTHQKRPTQETDILIETNLSSLRFDTNVKRDLYI